MSIINKVLNFNKANPAQGDIASEEGQEIGTRSNITTAAAAYTGIDIVQRAVNLLVDSCAEIPIDIGDKINGISLFSDPVRAKKLNTLLRYKPSMHMSANEFMRNIYMDLVLEGNAFVYFDGAFLYNLPAANVVIVTDKRSFISGYKYNNVDFSVNEVIRIRENAGNSIYRGESRLTSAMDDINVIDSMSKYQQRYFDNNAVPGLVLSTTNILSDRIKKRTIDQWVAEYNPKKGGKRPMILDGDFKLEKLNASSFKELDFSASMTLYEDKILKTIGIPPVLLNSGNNANITPNLRLFYITTVIPLVTKVITALEIFFGYDLKPALREVLAMRPELGDEANYLTALTNAGIITRNEARADLRRELSDDEVADKLTLPANIAGSAADPSQGGRPEDNTEEN